MLECSLSTWAECKTAQNGGQSLREPCVFWCPPSYLTIKSFKPNREGISAACARMSAKDSSESLDKKETSKLHNIDMICNVWTACSIQVAHIF